MAHQATLQFSFHLLELPPIAAMVLYSAMHFTGAIRCFTGRWYRRFAALSHLPIVPDILSLPLVTCKDSSWVVPTERRAVDSKHR